MAVQGCIRSVARIAVRSVALTGVLLASSSSTAFELQVGVIGSGGGTSQGSSFDVSGTLGDALAGGSSGPSLGSVGGLVAALPAICRLDVDGNGIVGVSTDVVYVARHLLTLAPVPASFRTADPTIADDAVVAAAIDQASSGLDVDGSGETGVSTDIVYLARYLLDLDPVPPSFRVADPNIPADDSVAQPIRALCPEIR